uniref:Capsid protein n=1 Tax=Fringilla montifringilla Chaphamaparvovirus TaxID=2794489 RepID=A0A8A4XDG1_9VIRU|nr:MAG: capsid protein [Fringilla montifringilla Chaphamaparvovirus]
MEHSITNLRSIYWDNQIYRYPLPYLKAQTTGSRVQEWPGNFLPPINTGWHILPNMLWGHLASPRQWWEMVQKFEAISVTGVTMKIFNPIPIQTAISFQGTNTFPAFNNTVYSLTYTDDLYETPWFDWTADVYANNKPINMYYEFNPAFKEGLVPNSVNQKFPQANDIADSMKKLEQREDIYPKQYFSMITQNTPSSVQNLTYRRQFLPIYWYTYPFPQYERVPAMDAWRHTLSWWESAWFDPSGTFWDPLNRPDNLGELRPGKNMISFSWNVHPSDQGIWFNTDRIALLTPYPRPRPLQIPRPTLNRVDNPQVCNPITPGPPTSAFDFLKRYGLVTDNEPLQIPSEVMAPETHTGLPDWRKFPIVPTRWFLKEIEESNPWINTTIEKIYYRDSPSNCPQIQPQTGTGIKKGDVQITAPMENARLPGTEYEMYKYPPTQWFIKGVPLYDDGDKQIPVQFQAFMLSTVHVLGKPRKSALYAPSWGPYIPQDLYSVNMDTPFGENYIRGRSGGARRTWLNPDEPRPVRNVPLKDIYIWKDYGGGDEVPTNIPVNPESQCIVEPANESYARTEWPRRSVVANSDRGITVTLFSNEEDAHQEGVSGQEKLD